MAGVLSVVATPIGNLGDFSPRARAVLQAAAAVVCEDTRVTRKLLAGSGISVPTVSCHHHSSPSVVAGLVARLMRGENLALVTDAGTPGVSDPGGVLVAAAAAAGISVVAVPGPSAVAAALSVAGFPANRFLFLGYPPHKKGRATFFREAAACPYTVVLYESTHRILKTLAELGSAAPSRALVVCRELTKLHETVYRGTAAAIMVRLSETSSKGEFVVIVDPAR